MYEGEEMYEGIESVIEDEIERYRQFITQDEIEQAKCEGAIEALIRLLQIFEGEID